MTPSGQVNQVAPLRLFIMPRTSKVTDSVLVVTFPCSPCPEEFPHTQSARLVWLSPTRTVTRRIGDIVPKSSARHLRIARPEGSMKANLDLEPACKVKALDIPPRGIYDDLERKV